MNSFLVSREKPLPSFPFFLLSGNNGIIKESSSRTLVDLKCGPFSQNSLAFHPHVPALEAGCLGIEGQRGKMLNFGIWWHLGGATTQIASKVSGGGEGKENLTWP